MIYNKMKDIKDKVQICEVPYTVELCRANPNSLFVFGDNYDRWGKGGQAIIRDRANAVGIATKVSPSEFMTDKHFIKNVVMIARDIENIIYGDMENVFFKSLEAIVGKGLQTIYFPKHGLGTGLADLPNKAALTWEYLCDLLIDVFGFDNRAAYQLSKTEKI